ncbi:hypothetical protein [Flavobacterium sp.]
MNTKNAISSSKADDKNSAAKKARDSKSGKSTDSKSGKSSDNEVKSSQR